MGHAGLILGVNERALGAFWGAAIGDALGWPNEMPGRRVRQQGRDAEPLASSFEAWRRRSGGRFMPHEEVIVAGEYSDDTQLLLCTARSLLHGHEWLRHFSCMELPAWSLYRRGGGAATNRAVESWTNGQVPWSSPADDTKRRMYFDAGGNGVAMRILPHALSGIREKTFRSTARAIVLNGICTHGHPRALLGALAYGYLLWQALSLASTLAYGQLLELVVRNLDDWSEFPDSNGVLSEWRDSAQRTYNGQFVDLWSKTIEEMRALFERGLKGIRAGALSVDSRVLSDLGCFDKSTNGAGTVCAAAAAYIASKYAPDPQNGVLEAASAKGADTDTLASMAGAILGGVAGTEWLQSYRGQLQDERYIAELAQSVSKRVVDQESAMAFDTSGVRPRVAVDRTLDVLRRSSKDDELELPDGRRARLEEVKAVDTSSRTLTGRIWKLRTADGQTIYIKKFERTSADDIGKSAVTKTGERIPRKKAPRFTSKVKAIKIIVADLERSRRFYAEVLGLRIVRESRTLVNFGGVLSLVPLHYTEEMDLFPEERVRTRSIICIETSSLEKCHERVATFVEARVTPMHLKAGRRVFRCFDFDSNVLEVFETSASPATSEPS
jgi:ADP-ribosylglycohydrolase/catechol 2,3-dioxygenase-like lactoylglutathione lyase family enzyme